MSKHIVEPAKVEVLIYRIMEQMCNMAGLVAFVIGAVAVNFLLVRYLQGAHVNKRVYMFMQVYYIYNVMFHHSTYTLLSIYYTHGQYFE